MRIEEIGAINLKESIGMLINLRDAHAFMRNAQ